MLKHATPRSSPCLVSTSQESRTPVNGSSSGRRQTLSSSHPSSSSSSSSLSGCAKTSNKSYNERSIDCEGIVVPSLPSSKRGEGTTPSVGLSLGGFIGEKILSLGSLNGNGAGIGPVITHGKAIVRRGLSFSSKSDSDAVSVRSVKSEGHGVRVHRTNFAQHQQHLQKAKSILVIPTKTETNSSEASEEREGNSMKETGVKQPSDVSKEPTNTPQKKTDNSNTKDKQTKPSSSKSYKKIFGISKHDHPSLKTLLRLPGVYGHIPVPESAPYGTPHILSPDSLSLSSSVSFVSSNSGRTSSRSWSSNASSNSNHTSDSSASNCSSTSEPASTTLKVFAKCLRSDIEYKTVSIGSKVTCRELINILLSKAKMKHRDPNLFYLTMEVTVRRWSGVPVRALLVLEESAKPAQLALCRPSGDLKFVLQMRKGGIIKIHDTVLMPGSQYKSLLISYRTTAEDAVQLLLNCYGRNESKNFYALHELCQFPEYKDRRLEQKERPLEVKAEWPKDRRAEFVFVLRRNMTQALSLRKLTLRTLEQSSSKSDSKIEGRKGSEEKRTSEKEKQKVEETLIDCTSTVPVMKTLLREESNKVQSKNTNLQCTRDGKSLPWGNNKLSAFNLQLAHTQERQSLQRENKLESSSEVISDLFSNRWQNSSCRISFHSLPKDRITNKNPYYTTYNKTNEVADSQRQRNLRNVAKNEIVSSNSPKTEVISNNVSRKNPLSSNVRNEIIHNTIKNSAPTNAVGNDAIPTNITRNDTIHKKLPRNQVIPSPSKEVSTSTKNIKVLSSSAVQTELTCIPVKGTKAKYKWNSVETLLDAHYKPYIEPLEKKTNNFPKKLKENSGSENLITKSHPPDRNCHRQNCFYI